MGDIETRGATETAGSAARAWREALESWAIPEDILARAPESPWGHPVALFQDAAERSLAMTSDTPSRARAREALEAGGSVLDVGAGAGAASLPLVPPAALLLAADESDEMLRAFAEKAAALGVQHREFRGRWPDEASSVPGADVVVCHHVAYNVADLGGLFAALDSHAGKRVVVELTGRHPQADLNPLWKEIHGIERPTRPTAEDAAAVAEELGFRVHVERFEQTNLWHNLHRDARVTFTRRRLCVGPEYDDFIAAWIDRDENSSTNRQLATIWWDTRSPRGGFS